MAQNLPVSLNDFSTGPINSGEVPGSLHSDGWTKAIGLLDICLAHEQHDSDDVVADGRREGFLV